MHHHNLEDDTCWCPQVVQRTAAGKHADKELCRVRQGQQKGVLQPSREEMGEIVTGKLRVPRLGNLLLLTLDRPAWRGLVTQLAQAKQYPPEWLGHKFPCLLLLMMKRSTNST